MHRVKYIVFIIILFMPNVILAKTTEYKSAENTFKNKNLRLYVGQIGGDIPGMNNVVLKPRAVIGIKDELSFGSFINQIDIYTLYGKKNVDQKSTKNQFLEIRGELSSLYSLYKNRDIESFNVGLYSSFAVPFASSTPTTLFPGTAYSDEESEKISKELLLGTEINFRFTYDKIDSSLSTVFFFAGKKIAPNLLAYKPLYKLAWENNLFLIGTVTDPKLELSTSMQFWFAKKANVSLFNTHDGIGGTKREFDYELKLRYFFNQKIDTYVTAYGFNNLNRGNSNNSPYGFKDGYGCGLEYRF